MNPNDATRVISVIDKRIQKHIGVEGTTETTWGEVCDISADGRYVSAYLFGESEEPSQDFRLPGSLAVAVGDKVKVAWNSRGERWVYDVALASSYKKIAIDPNAGTIKVGDGTSLPAILIADSSGVVVGTHNHDADYEPLGAVSTHEGLSDPHPGYATDSDLTTGLATKADSTHYHWGGPVGDEVFLTSTASVLIGSSDVEYSSSFRVTYPGNANQSGRDVVLYVYIDLSNTWGAATAEFNVSLMDTDGNRYAFTRSDAPVAAQYVQTFTASVVRFDATVSKTFKMMVRRPAGNSNFTGYGHASAEYVSRIGFIVAGYTT